MLAAPMFAQTTQFTKRVSKVNGAAVSSDPSSVSNGDLLDWVLTFQYNPVPAPAAKSDIRDLLPPSLVYVPGTLTVPPSWSGQWFSGSWVSSPPANATGVGAVTAPNLTPFGAGQSALIPAPPSASISTSGLGGDGYRAISHNGRIFVINHHITGRYLDCFDAATGVRCPGYPGHVPIAAGTTYVGNNNGDNTTPFKTFEYILNDRLYFAVQKAASPFEIGVLCADLTSQTSCGFTPLASATSMNNMNFQGVGGMNGKVYVQLPTGKLGCADTSGNPCPGQPYTVVPALNFNQVSGTSDIIGSHIYTTWMMGGPGFRLTCFDTATALPCAGSWPKTPDAAGFLGNLYRLLNATGAVAGVCTHTVMPVNAAFSCHDLSTGASLPYPASYAAWAQTYGGGTLVGSYALGQPGYSDARVFNGRTSGGAAIGCYDFVTQAACAEPGWPVGGINITQTHYATIGDPERPGCMWSYGDDGKLGSFQAADHQPCGSKATSDTIITPSKSYCATGGDISAWDKLYVSGLTLGGGITASLTLYDGNNPMNLAVNSTLAPYAQNLAVTSFPVTLGSGGLGIGYGSAAGQYKSLRVVLTFSGLTSNAAWSQSPPPSIEVTWKGAPPEFCFRTKVATCEDPVVKNQATAVTTPVIGGVPINVSAPNPPFSATHLFGSDCPAKLTIVKSVPGAPAGFSGTFNFYVTCATSAGVVQQQLSINWPNTTVTLPNVLAGATCTVSESPLLPSLPSGYSWNGLPAVTPVGGVIHIVSGAANQVSFVNTVRHCDDRGAVKVRKQVQGAPAGFSGTFTFNVSCWSGSTLTTQQVQINYPGQTVVTAGGIPTGASCTVTETGALPSLPAGWFWEAPLYQPGSGQVSLIGTCCPEVVITNRAKFCCRDAAGTPQYVEESQ